MLPQAGEPRRREHSRAGRGRPQSGRLRRDRAPRSRDEPPCRDRGRDVCRRVARPRTVTEAEAIAGSLQGRWRELVRQRSGWETAAQVPGLVAEQTLRCRERAAADGVSGGGGGAGGGAPPRFSASARRAAAATPVPPEGAVVGGGVSAGSGVDGIGGATLDAAGSASGAGLGAGTTGGAGSDVGGFVGVVGASPAS